MTNVQQIAAAYNWTSIDYDRLVAANFNAPRGGVGEAVEDARNILEVGIGTGLNLPNYPEKAKVTGVDASSSMTDQARNRGHPGQLEIITSSFADVELGESTYDAGVMTWYLSVTPTPKADIKKLIEVTEPGATLVILDQMRDNPGFWQQLGGSISYGIWHFNPCRDIAELLMHEPVKDVKRIDLGTHGQYVKKPTTLLTMINAKA